MAGRIPDEIIQQVLDRTDIVALIGTYLPLRQAGSRWKALCPFHTEKTPSFLVNPERQIFHCFGCGKGGSAVTFLMEHERFTFPGAFMSRDLTWQGAVLARNRCNEGCVPAATPVAGFRRLPRYLWSCQHAGRPCGA